MTEDEAKTKWCPYASFKFSAMSDSAGANREGGPSHKPENYSFLEKGTRCLASACMAWRWRVAYPERPPHLNGLYPGPPAPPPIVSDTEGRCGLAGTDR